MSEFVKAAITEELAPGSCKTVELSGSRIALFNVAGSFYAMDDTCAHRGGPLGEGTLRRCHRHLPMAWMAVRRLYRRLSDQPACPLGLLRSPGRRG